MCQVIPFPCCFYHLTQASAAHELECAAAMLQDARDREIRYAPDWYSFCLERFSQAELWLRTAHDEAMQGA